MALFSFNVVAIQPASASGSAPMIDPIPTQTVYEGAHVLFKVHATDPDGDPLTYTVTQLPAGAAFQPDGIFEWQPDYNQSGDYTAAFRVSDGTNTVDTSVPIKVLKGDPLKPAVGKNGTLHGAALKIPLYVWDLDISGAPVLKHNAYHFSSDEYINSSRYQKNRKLFPVFGTYWDDIPSGISYNVVDNSVPKVPVKILYYPDESDLDPGSKDTVSLPIPENPYIENTFDPTSPNPGDDRHLLILNRDTSTLYECYNIAQDPNTGAWAAEGCSIFTPENGYQRPVGWTSSDAAGLPVLPGLVRYDEIQAGAINHAIRVTFNVTAKYFIPPAKHYATRASDTNPQNQSEAPLLPMGARLRLKSDFDISHFPKTDQIILTTLKKYGMIVADNGMDFAICGASDYRFDDAELGQLKNVPATAFELVDTGNWEQAYTVHIPEGSHLVNKPVKVTVKLNPNVFKPYNSTLSSTNINMKIDIVDDLGEKGTVNLTSNKPTATLTYTPTMAGIRKLSFSNDLALLNSTPLTLEVKDKK
jgi:hypothetical protein